MENVVGTLTLAVTDGMPTPTPTPRAATSPTTPIGHKKVSLHLRGFPVVLSSLRRWGDGGGGLSQAWSNYVRGIMGMY